MDTVWDIDVKEEETVDLNLKDSNVEILDETNVMESKDEAINVKLETVDMEYSHQENSVGKDIKMEEEEFSDELHEHDNFLQNFKVKEENVNVLDFEDDDVCMKEEEVFYNPESGLNVEIDTLEPPKKERILVENQAEKREKVGNEKDEPPPLANDVDEDAANEFIRKMKSTFTKYSPFSVFNAVKMKLNLKILQSQLPNAVDKIAFILCGNASGDFKLRPACVIKESDNTISSNDMKSLPVWFAATQSGEIDEVIFMQWYSKEFIPKVSEYLRKKSLPKEVLLLLDDSYSRLSDSFKMHDPNFKVMFFPPRTAALIQPLSQPEVIKEFTEACKRRFESFKSPSTPCEDEPSDKIQNKNSAAAKASPSAVPSKNIVKHTKDSEMLSEDSSKKSKRVQRSITDYMKKKC